MEKRAMSENEKSEDLPPSKIQRTDSSLAGNSNISTVTCDIFYT